MSKTTKQFLRAAVYAFTFILWTVLLRTVDVQPIGPDGTAVGFATLNGCVHRLTGVCMPIYTVTDWLGLVPIAVGLGFATLGFVQCLRRKSVRKVDFDLLVLGGFYLMMLGVYLLFETVVINYRPVLINGCLEVSYPSSTTLLTLCVMPTAAWQWRRRIHHPFWRRAVPAVIHLFTLFMVGGRLLAGVHWLTDIVGGILLAAAMVTLYDAVCRLK